MTDNPISNAVQWYADNGPNPLVSAGLLGLAAYGTGRLAWGPVMETARSIGRPLGTRMFGSTNSPVANRKWDRLVDEFKEDPGKKRVVPAVAGMLTTLATLGLLYSPNQPYKGMLQWQPGTYAMKLPAHMLKQGAMDMPYNHVQDMGMDSYVTELDWNRRVNAADVMGLFKNDPHLADEPYARNMGVSIVAGAAMDQHTRKPTLGGIFDSAVGKIENKLTFGGLLDTGVKTVVANGISRLFASSVGAMMDLDPKAQQRLVDAGTWAGAVTAMLT